jgi:hypothetical protein
VLDAEGRGIPVGPTRTCATHMGPARQFAPGREMTLAWWRSPPVQVWLDLRSWGYDLKEPGDYTIVGAPRIGRRGPWEPDSALSNAVQFRIEL